MYGRPVPKDKSIAKQSDSNGLRDRRADFSIRNPYGQRRANGLFEQPRARDRLRHVQCTACLFEPLVRDARRRGMCVDEENPDAVLVLASVWPELDGTAGTTRADASSPREGACERNQASGGWAPLVPFHRARCRIIRHA